MRRSREGGEVSPLESEMLIFHIPDKRKHRDHKLIYTVQQGSVSEKVAWCVQERRRLHISITDEAFREHSWEGTTHALARLAFPATYHPGNIYFTHGELREYLPKIFRLVASDDRRRGRTLKLFSSPSANKRSRIFLGKTSSAITIQSHWRGHVSRQRASRLKQIREWRQDQRVAVQDLKEKGRSRTARMDRAAVVLQSLVRQHQCRHTIAWKRQLRTSKSRATEDCHQNITTSKRILRDEYLENLLELEFLRPESNP